MRISKSYPLAACVVIEELGFDSSMLQSFEGLGLSGDDLPDLCRRIAVSAEHHPELGLRIGRSLSLGSHGIFGHALMSCRTLHQAARILMRYNPLDGETRCANVSYTADNVVLSFVPPFDIPSFPGLMSEIFYAAVANALRELLSTDLAGVSLELAHVPRMDEERFSELIKIRTTFGHKANRLLGPIGAMQLPLPAAEIETAPLYLEQCEKLLAQMGRAHGTHTQVRRILLRMKPQFPREGDVAAMLNISPRTLRRRLTGEGTSYQRICNEVRSHVACEYLRRTEIGIAEIGALVGFEDAANFRSAFKRWTGMSPSAFRAASADEPAQKSENARIAAGHDLAPAAG
ncbi:AraC-like DNA-binding protein [Parvibaculum indicum]|uniref:AraC family transcriptional regulator n=1 Tax=Parvibaculum indicum TaxID=562969 RepID=UPI001420995D|nr:AraC family transcriptional regulator [Parvibaculum indicum]NIJ42993.1 AraC-like DNA-binding protein [Parvibaculum indicum]